jgi:hypothetical protein
MQSDSTCQGVLSHKNTNDSDVCRARPLRPPDGAIDSGTVDECSEDEFAALMLRSCCENGNDEGSGAKRVPPHGNVIQVLENTHTKGVDQAYIRLSPGQRNKLRYTLS